MKKIIYGILCLMLPVHLLALNPSDFTITRVTAPYFVVDGNSPATLTKAYVGFKVKNVSGSTTGTSLVFTITSIGTSVVGQNYAVMAPATGVINVGTLAPGQSRVCYYYVSYPANVTPIATFNLRLSDATGSFKTAAPTIYNRSSISANAGGTATQSFTNQDVIGGKVYDDVTYAVGNVQNGDESDFQVAVSTSFDPTKLQLLSTNIQASSVPGIAVNTADSLYFVTGNGSNGSTVTVRFTFRITGFNFTNYLLPSAGSTSGATNYKYALNTSLGSGSPVVISSSANPLTVTKTVNKINFFPNEVATFTITIGNPSAYGVSIDKITDQVPAGFTFTAIDVTSQVTSATSTSVPAASSTGTITFNAGLTGTGTSTYFVPAGGTLVLKYTATAPGYASSNLSGTANAYVATVSIGNATTTVNVTATLPLTLLSFNGEWLNDRVQLKWVTTNEQNTAKIEIERSAGNGEYIKLGERIAAGFSYTDISYEFMDYAPTSDINKYRLKMIDADGRINYSQVIAMKGKISSTTISSAFPNPFKGSIMVSLDLMSAQTTQLQILNSAGEVVSSEHLELVKGKNNVLIQDLDKLPHGIYALRVKTEAGYLGRMIMK